MLVEKNNLRRPHNIKLTSKSQQKWQTLSTLLSMTDLPLSLQLH
jgi:hypothetical protein